MASSTTIGFPVSVCALTESVSGVQPARRRRINPQAGRALEILGHSIEYLLDEVMVGHGTFSELEAIRLLMALNRQIYFECPELPTLGERLQSLLHLHAA
jgi:hypothetical protein